MSSLEKEVKERVKKDSAKEQAESEQPIINPGGFNTLLLTQGAVGSAPTPVPPVYTNGVSPSLPNPPKLPFVMLPTNAVRQFAVWFLGVVMSWTDFYHGLSLLYENSVSFHRIIPCSSCNSPLRVICIGSPPSNSNLYREMIPHTLKCELQF